jgi:sulfotransferase
MKFHFISGLPRSGSTLLAALLRQNPRFSAAMTSPVAAMTGALIQKMSGASEFATFFSDQKRTRILRSLFEGYYGDTGIDSVVFDTNRTWTSKMPLLATLYPEARVICCVRDVSWIIDSVERLVRKNPLQPSRMFNYKTSGTVYSRVEILMNPESGLIGLPWRSLREAWFGEYADKLIVIKYESIAKEPQSTIERLYLELGEKPFQHNFDHIEYNEPDYDMQLGIPELHKVRPKVEFQQRDSCLPPDLVSKYSDTNFWLRTGLNPKKVVTL